MSGITLHALAARAGADATVHGHGDVRVVDAHHASGEVTPGSLFCCVPGRNVDGHDFAQAALDAGATALLVERPLGLGVPELVVPSVRDALGPVAAAVHGDPSGSLVCVGITGTNGKTSTVAILDAILTAAGHEVLTIGTLTGTRTTPEATDLQRLLAHARDDGRTAVIMEVSSHALELGRVSAMRFALAVFTNLSPDHLDFHGTMSNYFRAKARLFEPGYSAQAVVNLDDPHGRLLVDAALVPTSGFSAADADPVTSVAPLAFTWRGEPVAMALAGRFNLENALAAATAGAALGCDDDVVRRGLEAARPVPGRLEPIESGQPFRVLVDFAHTPAGIQRVLATARELAAGRRVIVVVGAGGDRDRSKRALMGAAAEHGADVVFVTNDNPRSEDPGAIASDLLSGMDDPDRAHVVLDRREAIDHALDAARPGDVVIVAGKGHERVQIVGGESTAFDDRQVAGDLLAQRGWVS